MNEHISIYFINVLLCYNSHNSQCFSYFTSKALNLIAYFSPSLNENEPTARNLLNSTFYTLIKKK